MSSTKFVFDINTFISAALIEGSVNDLALDKAFKTGKVIVSEATFAELTEVLFRKKFDKYLTDERRLQILQKLERDTVICEVNITLSDCSDPKDNKFLELAVAANAFCIVTGDKDLLVMHPFRNIAILSSADFLKIQ
ncbi:MAG TPA: putative toxin-antitoxin system toxin component, PIN family [Hanamia sp.]|nr:putative toxin-antitoxin system toxin component, PIN family [Hanamia sp.]